MKKMFNIFVATLLLAVFAAASIPVAFAAETSSQVYQDDKVNDLLPKNGENSLVKTEGGKQLPTGDFKTSIIPKTIKLFLMFVGTISFGVFIYGGINLVIAQGNEEDITKFKNMLIWSAAGLTFITVSYGIVSGIMQVSFT